MKTAKNVLALILAACMLTPLVACSENKTVNEENTSDTAANLNPEIESETVVEEEEDDLTTVLKYIPDIDYDGYTYSQWMGDHQLTSTIYMRQGPEEEMTGEPINDALWTRDRAMEAKFNIKMEYNATGSVVSDATKTVRAGDDSIGLLYLTMVQAPTYVNSGLALDISQIDKIDLTKPYWSQYATKELAIDGHIYYATGDITTRYAGAPYILLFNKKLLTDRGMELPYDYVDEGTWTFDKLHGMVVDQYQDANGNSKADPKDFYGFAYEHNMQGFAFYNGFGYTAARFEGTEVVIGIKDEEQINALDPLVAFAALPDVYHSAYTYQETEIFKADMALFCGQTACNLFLLTDMETDFGVVPVPKQNEAQEGYHSYCNLHCATSVHLTKATQNIDRAAILCDALAACSRVSSMRAQYEMTLKYRQTRDEQSVRMVQIASEAGTYDPANLYNLGGLYGVINECVDKGSPISSKLKALEKMVSKTGQKIVKNLIENEG